MVSCSARSILTGLVRRLRCLIQVDCAEKRSYEEMNEGSSTSQVGRGEKKTYDDIESAEEVNIEKFRTKGTNYAVRFNNTLANLVPRLFLRGRKDPGRSWSRATQILGGKLKKHLGRGGRVLRLENYNLCA